MITAIEGVLEEKGPGWAVIKTGGFSFKVLVPESTGAKLGPPGGQVRLNTFLYFREDNLALCGFTGPEELRLFAALLEVRGVGVKLALALLSAMSPAELVSCISRGDERRLRDIPGVGRTTAGRLILELKDKLKKGWAVSDEIARGADDDLMAALSGLGYSSIEVKAALDRVTWDPYSSLEERLRLALKSLGTPM